MLGEKWANVGKRKKKTGWKSNRKADENVKKPSKKVKEGLGNCTSYLSFLFAVALIQVKHSNLQLIRKFPFFLFDSAISLFSHSPNYWKELKMKRFAFCLEL